MTTAVLPYGLTGGTAEDINKVQADHEYLRDLINGNLDQANLSTTGITNILPWTVDVDPFTTAATNTNWSTINIDTAQIKNGTLQSTGAQNAVVGWDVVLAAGTWTLNILTLTASSQGIYTAALDGTSIGTMDGYSASTTYNVSKSITGITVAATGKKRFTLTMATKNASATQYRGNLSAVRWLRTA